MFLEKELSYRVMGCFYKVRNLYGGGHRESFYDKILDEVFNEESLNFVDKPQVAIYSLQTGKNEKNFRPRRYIYTNDNKPFLAQTKYL